MVQGQRSRAASCWRSPATTASASTATRGRPQRSVDRRVVPARRDGDRAPALDARARGGAAARRRDLTLASQALRFGIVDELLPADKLESTVLCPRGAHGFFRASRTRTQGGADRGRGAQRYEPRRRERRRAATAVDDRREPRARRSGRSSRGRSGAATGAQGGSARARPRQASSGNDHSSSPHLDWCSGRRGCRPRRRSRHGSLHAPPGNGCVPGAAVAAEQERIRGNSRRHAAEEQVSPAATKASQAEDTTVEDPLGAGPVPSVIHTPGVSSNPNVPPRTGCGMRSGRRRA